MRRWPMQVLIALDQLLNAVADGWADETVSSRAWRMRERSKAWDRMRRAIDMVFGSGHCADAYSSERRRAHSPPEERTADEHP